MAKEPKKPSAQNGAEAGDANLDINKAPVTVDTMSPEEREALEERLRLIAKRKGKKKKHAGGGPQLSITSLMDAFTIILVFLLKSYSTDPTNITPTDDMQPPKSIASHKNMEVGTAVIISGRNIVVEGNAVVQVKEGKVSAQVKRDGEDSFFITPLHDALKERAEMLKKLAKLNSQVKFKGLLFVIADHNTPFRLLTEVLYTAGQAEFGKFEFAVSSMGAQ